ncbi:hypothetical protein GWK47_048172 [Chionoecetes opilio]|uniref:Uncharacterized protein n=1 Tax=Chionoecetes opilio TaxID=41210 RepID=A0A8J4Y5K8_CHIOP|nr:hypothetical protein GWK47_048172 [Chionoecetes opilio]
MVGKRRGGRILATGMVKKQRREAVPEEMHRDEFVGSGRGLRTPPLSLTYPTLSCIMRRPIQYNVLYNPVPLQYNLLGLTEVVQVNRECRVPKCKQYDRRACCHLAGGSRKCSIVSDVPAPVAVGVRGLTEAVQPKPVEGGKTDAWSQYMSEVRKYKEQSCEEEGKRRPLVK